MVRARLVHRSVASMAREFELCVPSISVRSTKRAVRLAAGESFADAATRALAKANETSADAARRVAAFLEHRTSSENPYSQSGVTLRLPRYFTVCVLCGARVCVWLTSASGCVCVVAHAVTHHAHSSMTMVVRAEFRHAMRSLTRQGAPAVYFTSQDCDDDWTLSNEPRDELGSILDRAQRERPHTKVVAKREGEREGEGEREREREGGRERDILSVL